MTQNLIILGDSFLLHAQYDVRSGSPISESGSPNYLARKEIRVRSNPSVIMGIGSSLHMPVPDCQSGRTWWTRDDMDQNRILPYSVYQNYSVLLHRGAIILCTECGYFYSCSL